MLMLQACGCRLAQTEHHIVWELDYRSASEMAAETRQRPSRDCAREEFLALIKRRAQRGSKNRIDEVATTAGVGRGAGIEYHSDKELRNVFEFSPRKESPVEVL
jgi:hypothetical protein